MKGNTINYVMNSVIVYYWHLGLLQDQYNQMEDADLVQQKLDGWVERS